MKYIWLLRSEVIKSFTVAFSLFLLFLLSISGCNEICKNPNKAFLEDSKYCISRFEDKDSICYVGYRKMSCVKK
jgi:hypothetical protein